MQEFWLRLLQAMFRLGLRAGQLGVIQLKTIDPVGNGNYDVC